MGATLVIFVAQAAQVALGGWLPTTNTQAALTAILTTCTRRTHDQAIGSTACDAMADVARVMCDAVSTGAA